MSNGLTAVFISVLSLSASHLARVDREVDFAIWLASNDQAIVGRGTVGFDISEMPWSVENFEAEKSFILQVIDAAKARQYWNMLDYEPREEWTLYSLEKFRELIEDFTEEFVNINDHNEEPGYKPDKIERCSLHNVYLHWAGCVVCNDK